MVIVQYFLDRDITVQLAGIEQPENSFADYRAPIKHALAQEQPVTDQVIHLAKAARDEGDLLGEQFMQWFLEEQVDEAAIMRTLQTVADRCDGNLFDLENFISREIGGAAPADATAPTVAGGHL